MANNVGEVELIAKINTDNYKKGEKEIVSANKNIEDSAESSASGSTSAFSKIGSSAVNAGKVVASGLLIGAAAITGLVTKMALSGAELEQQLGGSEAVFGEFAQGIQNKALDAYKNAGLSQAEFLAGANKMGSLFQGAGVSVEDSMQMSADAMQRASDVASIMGIDTQTALESVTGAAKGNYTMMDNLGVAMNETALNAYALEKGINKTTQQMTAQEKAQLAMQMFMDKTAKYAGNYAKENETLAGSINTTKKAFDNFLATGGGLEEFTASAIDTIKILVPNVLTILETLPYEIGGLIDEILPVIADAFSKMLPGVLTAAIKLIDGLVRAFPTVIASLVRLIPELVNGFVQIFMSLVQALPIIIPELVKGITSLITVLTTELTKPQTLLLLFNASIQLLLALVQAIPQIITALANAIPTIIDNLVTFLTTPANIAKLVGASVQLFMALVQAVPLILGALFNAFGSLIGRLWDRLTVLFSSFAGNFGQVIGQVFKNAINGMLRYISNFINNPIDQINSAINAINKIPGVNMSKLGRVSIPLMAEGGIVTGPTLAMIGEGRESEAVIPLSKLDDMLAGGNTSSQNITVTVNGVFATSAIEQRKVAQQIVDRIKEVNQAKGLQGAF